MTWSPLLRRAEVTTVSTPPALPPAPTPAPRLRPDPLQLSASASRRGTHARQSRYLLGPRTRCADGSTPKCGSPPVLAYLQGGHSEWRYAPLGSPAVLLA